MIHTFKIQHQIKDYQAVRILADCMGFSKKEINDFIYYNRYTDKKSYSVLSFRPNLQGYEQFTLYHRIAWNRTTKSDYHLYMLYLRAEPLTIINREQHIALFDCSPENIDRLVKQFRKDMLDLFGFAASTEGNLFILEQLSDLKSWEAYRVDFTFDAKMKNKDEVLMFINLAKMSVISNQVTHAKYTSCYDDNFYNKSFQFHNDTRELHVYNKEQQIDSKRKKLDETLFNRLKDESHNIVRVEFRLFKRGIDNVANKLSSRNIINFLNEKLGNKCLTELYESTIGLEDFYRKAPAEKKLDEAFPMTQKEQREEQKRKRQAEKQGDVSYIPEKHSAKYHIHRNHIRSIMQHKGMQNAYDSYLSGSQNKERASKQFKTMTKTIRERAHISPVLIPDNWVKRRKLSIQNVLANPIKQLMPKE